MSEYLTIAILMGAVFIYGVIYTIRVFYKLNGYLLKRRYLEVVQLFGAILIILGSAVTGKEGAISSNWPWIFLSLSVTLVGVFLLVFPFAKTGHLSMDKESIFQTGIIGASIVMYPWFTSSPIKGFAWGALVVGILILILIMIRIPLSFYLCTPFDKHLIRIASWLLVIHSWLRYYGIGKVATCPHYWVMLLYFSALLVWLYSVMGTYRNIARWL